MCIRQRKTPQLLVSERCLPSIMDLPTLKFGLNIAACLLDVVINGNNED